MYTAKSRCNPSSREMSSLANERPGRRPRFLSQKTAQKAPEKKMPSTAAKAMRRSAKVRVSELVQYCIQSILLWMLGKLRVTSKSRFCSVGSLTIAVRRLL